MTLPEVADKMDITFNTSELRDLCFRLEVDYDNLASGTRNDSIRELVQYCERHGRIDELLELCNQLRPNNNWDTLKINSSKNRSKKSKKLNKKHDNLDDRSGCFMLNIKSRYVRVSLIISTGLFTITSLSSLTLLIITRDFTLLRFVLVNAIFFSLFYGFVLGSFFMLIRSVFIFLFIPKSKNKNLEDVGLREIYENIRNRSK